MRVFVDTSAFYAVLDRDDACHARARRAWHKLIEGGEHAAITTNYVVVETVAVAQNRLGVQAVRTFVDDVLALVSVEFVSSGAHRSGVAALLAASRRGVSLVDCVSFEVMRAAGIQSAFAFDRHFAEQGFASWS